MDCSILISKLPDLPWITDVENLVPFSKDYTEDLQFLPDLAIAPTSADDIAKILKICNQFNIPVTTRGAGTGLSGAALPVAGGVVVSTEKLDKIIQIDTLNMQATVETGVVNAHLKEAVAAYGLSYPPDPASFGSCSIGGNIAHGAGGPRAVKYGITKDYILNLEVVLPSGEIIWTGSNTLKNSTGFNLTQLMIGSEGMLGIITKAVVKLVPLPTQELLLLAAFDSLTQCAKAVSAVLQSSVKPAAIELMETSGIEISMKATQTSFPLVKGATCYLLFSFDGFQGDDLFTEIEKIYLILDELGAIDIMPSPNSDTANDWWKVRRAIGETVKQKSIYKEEDTVVPRYSLPELLSEVKRIGEKYGFESVCYGHAGDGNLHVNILKNELSDDYWNHEVPKGIREIFECCKKLGGTISGEHGIGYSQKTYLDVVFTPTHFQLMKGIKSVFDPNGILNPGKWIR